MKTRLCSLCSGLAFSLFLMLGTGMIFSSCQDDLLEDSYPEWLGSSIYGELESRGNFTNTLQLIKDLGQEEVLRKTGSKTVFAADDAAWDRFFAKNEWGVKSYKELSESQLKWIFNNSMINAPYLEERLSSAPKSDITSDPNKGMWMRRANSTDSRDTIKVYRGEDLNKLPNNSYWAGLKREEVVYLMSPLNDAPYTVYLAADFRDNKQITDDDMQFIFGNDYDKDVESHRIDGKRAVYLWGNPVIEKDITCQNGYIHILRDLLVAPSNMAEELGKINSTDPAQSCSIFNSFLERYTIPATGASVGNLTIDGEPVYRKAYIAQAGTYATTVDGSGDPIAGQLAYDPSWHRNSFATGEAAQENMSAIFVPTDEALTNWWNSETGQLVMNGMNSWDDVPNDLLARLINNHMKTSFLGSVPSVFDKVLNDGNREQGIEKGHIAVNAQNERMIYPANNGIIYVVNRVYTPDSYISVMAPCLNVDNLKVMGFAVTNTDKTTYIPDGYGTYLNSMESSFTFIVPTDEALLNYVNPFYVGEDGRYQRVSLSLNSANRIASVYTHVEADGSLGSSSNGEPYYLDNGNVSRGDLRVKAFLKDILDNCIVVMKAGEDFTKPGYYQTKGGEYIYISGFDVNRTVQSGGNFERGETPKVSTFYNQSAYRLNGEDGSGGNGVTMAVDQAIQPTLSTVYDIVSKDEELSEFAKLLLGSDEVIEAKFSNVQDSLKLYQALILPTLASNRNTVISRGLKVGFLGNYNYTLYAPTNDAMREAYAQGLPTWDDLAARPVPDPEDTQRWPASEIAKEEYIRQGIAKKILNFIRMHFQDNSIFTDGEDGYYKTQAFNDQESVFYELQVNPSPQEGSFVVTSREVPSSTANVLTNSPTVNKMAREYQFNGQYSTPSVQGGANTITSSSKIVIQTIDAPLFFSPLGSDGIREQFK